MANSEWTQEEQRIAGQTIARGRDGSGVWKHGDYGITSEGAIDLQCSLNRLQEEVREAQEMLRNIENRFDPEWPISQDIAAWLSRNK